MQLVCVCLYGVLWPSRHYLDYIKPFSLCNRQLPFLNQRTGENNCSVEKISLSISTKELCQPWQVSNSQPPDHHLDAHPTRQQSLVAIFV